MVFTAERRSTAVHATQKTGPAAIMGQQPFLQASLGDTLAGAGEAAGYEPAATAGCVIGTLRTRRRHAG